MRMDFLTLFPDMFPGVLGSSILKRAEEKEAVSFYVHNIRDFSKDKHKKVDDYPYGGGAGMVLTPQPVFDACEFVMQQTPASVSPRIILLCPQGKPYKQRDAEMLSKEEHLIFICGHYEGYDERIREHLVTDEFSIGDYVLTGGELGALVIADSVTRLLPNVLGNESSHRHDSFSDGLLEYPQYTRPADFRGWKVPDVLLSGHHEKIAQWRKEQALLRTKKRRPDLLQKKEKE
ncbi:tRNA (guanosine(37)-N1)-methyltransferase TrmD [Aliibacillus thermotolerans]|uniref:tRNA (guanine-N(1)-)-methyltransferase n=1 Tax=Aliibacillus thermotolerans TaxID=1834418 RepID=A0ABW0U747_9BACI|nr:tRNA (guanosine(37)-N1)-methyltransferase TrmD [Aliibacillus thermotolerans]MDA3130637.1 tRNA (guanosine(37)-N1)-methyltransferase TrmD [Aliibacillus thermotolerans]